MLHIFKHRDGKFDIALVVRGKYIMGSNQHYERKAGCYNALKLMLNQVGFGTPVWDVIYFQDDTDMKKYYIGLHQPKPTLQAKQGRPSKPYIPSTRKK